MCVPKFKGPRSSLVFGIAFDSAGLLKRQGLAVLFRSIYEWVSGIDAEFGSTHPGICVNAAMPAKAALGWNIHKSELLLEQSPKYAEEEKEETGSSSWRKPPYFLPSASYKT